METMKYFEDWLMQGKNKIMQFETQPALISYADKNYKRISYKQIKECSQKGLPIFHNGVSHKFFQTYYWTVK